MSERRDPEELKAKLLSFARRVPFFNLIGFEVIEFGPRWSRCRLSPREEFRNPNGVVHGGVIAALIDAGITQAMLLTEEYEVSVREKQGFLTTIDLRIRYLRPVAADEMNCESKIVHLGRRIIHANSVVTNGSGKQLALGDSILTLVPREQRSA